MLNYKCEVEIYTEPKRNTMDATFMENARQRNKGKKVKMILINLLLLVRILVMTLSRVSNLKIVKKKG